MRRRLVTVLTPRPDDVDVRVPTLAQLFARAVAGLGQDVLAEEPPGGREHDHGAEESDESGARRRGDSPRAQVRLVVRELRAVHAGGVDGPRPRDHLGVDARHDAGHRPLFGVLVELVPALRFPPRLSVDVGSGLRVAAGEEERGSHALEDVPRRRLHEVDRGRDRPAADTALGLPRVADGADALVAAFSEMLSHRPRAQVPRHGVVSDA